MPSLNSLPPQRREVMAFIQREVNSGRSFPSHEEIARHMRWQSISSVTSVLRILSGQGFLSKWHEGRRWHFSLEG